MEIVGLLLKNKQLYQVLAQYKDSLSGDAPMIILYEKIKRQVKSNHLIYIYIYVCVCVCVKVANIKGSTEKFY